MLRVILAKHSENPRLVVEVEAAVMNGTKLIRSGATLLLCSPLFAGCILTMADGQADGAGGGDGAVSDTDAAADTGGSSFGDTGSADSSSSGDESGHVDETGGTTGGPAGTCSETLILDGGFEGGTPSSAWTEASQLFGTPICDVNCTTEEGAGPYAGDWYVWFGGTTDAEQASVSQHVTLDGTSAFLSFRLEINASAGTGDDVLAVTVDGQTVFMATDLEIQDYATYEDVSIDISAFVGGDHVIEIKSDLAGTGMSSFFVDEVSVVSCVDGDDSGGSDDGSDTSAGTSVGDSSTGDGATDSGGSSDGGGSESSSTGM